MKCLVDVFLLQACLCLSKVYHAMGNIAKARANITTAKTEALKIYTPPDMQGELDLQSGIFLELNDICNCVKRLISYMHDHLSL